MNDSPLKKCPTCLRAYQGVGALSRRDNKTEVCSDCGVREALEDFAGQSATNKPADSTTVRFSYAPKHVKFVYDEDSARVRAMFIHDDVEVSSKWLTVDEEQCITDVYPDVYTHVEYSINLKELNETSFGFDKVDGDDCNFVFMLHELSVR